MLSARRHRSVTTSEKLEPQVSVLNDLIMLPDKKPLFASCWETSYRIQDRDNLILVELTLPHLVSWFHTHPETLFFNDLGVLGVLPCRRQ